MRVTECHRASEPGQPDSWIFEMDAGGLTMYVAKGQNGKYSVMTHGFTPARNGKASTEAIETVKAYEAAHPDLFGQPGQAAIAWLVRLRQLLQRCVICGAAERTPGHTPDGSLNGGHDFTAYTFAEALNQAGHEASTGTLPPTDVTDPRPALADVYSAWLRSR